MKSKYILSAVALLLYSTQAYKLKQHLGVRMIAEDDEPGSEVVPQDENVRKSVQEVEEFGETIEQENQKSESTSVTEKEKVEFAEDIEIGKSGQSMLKIEGRFMGG